MSGSRTDGQMLQRAAAALADARQRIQQLESARSEPIAIVGMACRFPGAPDLDAFWKLLVDAGDAITRIDERRWPRAEDVPPATRWAGVVDALEDFDAEFFGITPREAHVLDPQQRLLLEQIWCALENATLVPSSLRGTRAGVYVGLSTHDYALRFRDGVAADSGMYIASGNSQCFAAGRASYVFGFEGPSVAIDTGCSSSLVALHLAAQGLRNRECDLAVAAGANAILDRGVAACLASTGAISRDGRCRTFDIGANGFVRGEGCGAVVLKRLSDALRAGDPIWAIVKGSAVNSDGRSSGLTAPNALAQEKVLREALRLSKIEPAQVGFIETHGTGTILGDPIEFAALCAAYGGDATAPRCYLGAVKTNIGHLEAAAGIAGVIKAALILHHETVPPNLHFARPNPRIELQSTRFAIPTAAVDWPHPSPRIAGVSSFGLSGTNAHAILEQASPSEPEPARFQRSHTLMVLSAHTPEALRRLCRSYAAVVRDRGENSLEDVCCSANASREQLRERAAFVAQSASELEAALDALEPAAVHPKPRASSKLAMVFTGQGTQLAGAGRALLESAPVFRAEFSRCEALLERLLGLTLRTVLYGRDDAPNALEDTRIAQPALFTLEFALAQLWLSWGVQPDFVIGHSLGRYVAACIAGTLRLEDALRIVCARAEQMQTLCPEGAMLAVQAGPSEILPLLGPGAREISLAAVNGPHDTVLAGDTSALERIAAVLMTRGVRTRRLAGRRAFHSALVEPMLSTFRPELERLPFKPPKIAFVCDRTGNLVRDALCDPAEWLAHTREPVMFADALATLRANHVDTFIEVGAHPTLLAAVASAVPDALCVPTLRRSTPDWLVLQNSLAALYRAGRSIDWQAWGRDFRSRRVRPPVYPFVRKRYWIEDDVHPTQPSVVAPIAAAAQPATSDLAYQLTWQTCDARSPQRARSDHWIVLCDDGGVGRRVCDALAARGQTCTLHDRVELESAGTDLQTRSGRLLELLRGDPVAAVVLDLTALDLQAATESEASDVMTELEKAFVPRLALVQALSQAAPSEPPRLVIVTRHAAHIPARGTGVSLAGASIVGFSKVVALEHPEYAIRTIDLGHAGDNDPKTLVDELLGESRESLVALREGDRWVPRLEPQTSSLVRELSLDPEAAYLITGGLGALARHVMTWLVDHGARRIVLASRREATPEQLALLHTGAPMDLQLLVRSVDVSSAPQLRSLIDEIRTRRWNLRGIVHTAGSVADAPLMHQSWSSSQNVFASKVEGAWNLHWFAGRELDFFAMFSSAASIFGSGAQANYTAANAALDALAYLRRSQGLAAISINWGPWDGAGLGTQLHQPPAGGVRALQPAVAVEWLGRALASEHPQLAILDVQWSRFMQNFDRENLPALLERWAEFARTDGGGRDSDLIAALAAPDAAARRRICADHVRRQVAEVLGLPTDRPLGDDEVLHDLGMDSLMAVEIRNRLARQLSLRLPATLLFEAPNVACLTDALLERLRGGTQQLEPRRALAVPRGSDADEIAVVGIGCRFPGGVCSPDAFWDLLVHGTDAICELPAARRALLIGRETAAAKNLQRPWPRLGALEDVAGFDAAFFGLSPRETAAMDPQQRLLLEVAWEALEHAGIPPKQLQGARVGVFLGISSNEYVHVVPADDPYFATGNALSTAAGRLSYVLGLRGPCIAVDTACSSSLAAVHLASQSLKRGECDIALAGGVNLVLSALSTVALQKLGALSPTDRCSAFAADADGYVRGEGCGVLVLERARDAAERGERSIASIRGSALNHDGRSNGLTAPNQYAQESVIRDALAEAGLEAGAVQYVEAHGTGTPLGDPIELQALETTYGAARSAGAPLFVGAVKTNIGHLEAAAGIAGLIKLLLAVERGAIPPNLHFGAVNPNFDWSTAHLRVPTRVEPWPEAPNGRIGGVSSFGFSGTNVHVLIGEAPRTSPSSQDLRSHQLLAISARSEAALRDLVRAYATHLEHAEQFEFAEICAAAARQRDHFEHRAAIVAASPSEARAKLAAWAERPPRSRTHHRPPSCAFLFPGQGSQFTAMAAELYPNHEAFREAIDRCDSLARDQLGRSVRQLLLDPAHGDQLADTRFTQPSLFVVEYALAALWQSFGVRPDFMLGHSLGEYVAATVSGLFSVEDALRLVIERGRLMTEHSFPGAMLGVPLSVDELASLIAGDRTLAIAAINGEAQVTVSGARESIVTLEARLRERGVRTHRLHVSFAFHSPWMAAVTPAYEQALNEVRFGRPSIPWVSNVTGALISDEAATASYWLRHMCEPVRFAAGVKTLEAAGVDAWLECGPGAALGGLARDLVAATDAVWVTSLARGEPAWKTLEEGLAGLYVRGAVVDWKSMYPHRHARRDLPRYAFQRKRYWSARDSQDVGAMTESTLEPSVHETRYELAWAPLPKLAEADDTPDTWLIVAAAQRTARELGYALEQGGASVIECRTFDLAMITESLNGPRPPRGIICMFEREETREQTSDGMFEEALACSARALAVIQAVLQAAPSPAPRLYFVTRGALRVLRAESLVAPQQAPVWGLVRSAAWEHPELRCSLVDVGALACADDSHALARFLLMDSPETQVALRFGNLYGARLRSAATTRTDPAEGRLELDPDATYLISGGTGGLGLSLASFLAQHGARHLVLLSRHGSVTAHADEMVESLKTRGVNVAIIHADVTDRAALAQVFEQVATSGRRLRGVFHLAGVLDDGVVGRQSVERLRHVMAPKVQGALLLHELTLGEELDHFVLYSSAASILGSPGQSNYAAANACLNALAEWRRSHGLKASSIPWGAFPNVGMAGKQSSRNPHAASTMTSVTPEVEHDVLTRVLTRERDPDAEELATRLDPSRARALFGLDVPPWLREVTQELTAEHEPPSRLELRSDDPTEAATTIRRYLLEQLADITGAEPVELASPSTLTFAELGLDSLMGLELKRRIERSLGVRVPTTAVFRYPDADALANHLVREWLDQRLRTELTAHSESTRFDEDVVL